MLNVNSWGRSSKLASAITKEQTIFKLENGDGVKFRISDSDHFYLTLYNGNVREVVKVVNVDRDTLTVERGQDETVSMSFPKGSCVIFEWNPVQLCEFIHQCANENTTKIKPQTVCSADCFCLDLDEGGHVIRVNRSAGC